MNPEELCRLSARELAAAIRDKSVSPVEVCAAVLDRIDRVNPLLNAFCTSMHEHAREAARQAEQAVMRGDSLGPLHGVPVSVKDNIYVEGVRTTFGSKLMEDDVSPFDAPVVERMRQAGAIIIGRTNTPEFGWKGVTDNRVFGTTRNPWNRELTPGGSSGGASAAVASGLGPIGLGTDGGGSLRIPAAFCGLVGHKPSFGRVPHYPGISVGSLRHLGAITRTVADSALALSVLAGRDERDPSSLPNWTVDPVATLDDGIAGLRVAYSPDLGYATVDAEVATVCQQAADRFSETGATVETIDLAWDDPYGCWSVLFYGGATSRLGANFDQHAELLDPGLRDAVEHGLQLTTLDHTAALAAQNEFWQQVRPLFERYDLLLTPSLAAPPFAVGQNNAELPGLSPDDLRWTQFTYPFNLTGQPACSVPCGWTPSGLPVGLQIIGRAHDDATVLGAARAWEQVAPWADRWPDLS